MGSLKLKTALAAVAALFGGCSAGSPRAAASPPQGAASDALPVVRQAAIPLRAAPTDFDPLIAGLGGATRVLLGESTHGTHEYYRDRARITHRLIRERGFNAVAIEGDWSPAYRVNLYVRGLGTDRSAAQALRGFTNFPRWMWPNTDFRDFVEQLRTHNLMLAPNQRVGVYGMDVYDLFEAADFVVERLGQLDAGAARRARDQYRCFARYGRNNHTYGVAAQSARASCQEEAAAVLSQVRGLARPSSPDAAEAHFALVRAASSVAAAEAYFRTTYAGANSWNLRDRQMAETVEDIARHAAALTGREGRVAMWSHNSHSGDARATSAGAQGELNIGQLMKQQHGDKAYAVGFFTNSGTVLAASAWDQPGRVFDLRPALPGSVASLFHRTGLPSFLLLLKGNPHLEAQLSSPMLERAVGVVYASRTERQSHYFDAVLPDQFDAAIFHDRTTAVRPL